MAILENRVKISSRTTDFLHTIQLVLKRFLVLIFIVLSLYLIYIAKPKQISSLTLEVIGKISTIGLDIYQGVFFPLVSLSEKFGQFKDLKAENLKLKLKLTELYNLESAVEALRAENLALRKLLNAVSDERYEYITARLLSVSLNPFSKTLLVGAGSKNGVKLNQVVTNSQGLIGRIIEVSDNYCRVMLINDLNSRVPIVTLLAQERGILAGNSQNTRIVYLQKNHDIKLGEKVITSGDGMMYPRGLIVGEISKITKNEVYVELVINFSKTDFVNIITNNLKLKETEKTN